MSKKSPLAATPTGDALTADEQKFFDTGGEEGGTTPNEPSEPVARDTKAADQVKPIAAAQGEDGAHEDGGSEPSQPNKPQKMVPHQALHEAREQTKVEKAERQRLQDQYKTLEERTNLLLKSFTEQQSPKVDPAKQQTAPDPENDPLGYLLWGMKSLAERQEKFEGTQKQQTEQAQNYSALQNLQSTALAQEEQFRVETPDYDAASQHLQKTRLAEFAAMGYSPQDSREMLRQEAVGIADRMVQQGKNPAEAIYEMAKLRGYAPAAPPAEPEPGVDQALVDANTDKLKTVQAGQKQAATLSQARGSAPQAMTANRLMEMSATEFEAFRQKSPKEFRNLMGN